MDAILIAVRFVHFTAAMLLFGASLVPLYTRADAAPLQRGIAAGTWIALLSWLAWLAWLAIETVSMSGQAGAWASPTMLAKVLHHTQFGHIWQWRAGLLSLLAILAILQLSQHRLFCIIAGLCVLTLAGVGHGDMGIGREAWLHLGIQATHLLAASIWVGGLAGLLSLLRRNSGTSTTRQALERFSLMGMVAVLLIVATGLVNSWFLVGSVHALLHTPYGHVLALKLSLFLAMVALACFNRCVLMPRSGEATADRILLRCILAEQALGIMVIAAVSMLGTMTPGIGMPGMPM